MKDNEIIQVLKNHIEAEDCVNCESFGKCDEFLLTEKVLDLITRQQAEIERLKGWENLLKAESHALIIKEAKSKAVKEFAERLCEDRVSNDPVVIATKCLVKEMVGDTERKRGL